MSAEEVASEGAPEWMVSYADMITILMSFFVVMFSMAGSKDPKKEEPVIMSLRRQFGRFVAMPSSQFVPRNLSAGTKNVGRQAPGDRKTRTRGLVGDNARVTRIREGDQQTIGCVIQFDGDASDLTRMQRQQLETTARDFSGKPQKIEIRGHTLNDPRPGAGAARDAWDLAYRRCHNTMEYLLTLGIDPRRLRIGVAAQYEPVYIGRDPLLLEKNSRVEVFMLNEFAEDLRGMGDESNPK